MRGGEEVIRTLATNLSSSNNVTVIASDSVDIVSEFSFKGRRSNMPREKMGENLEVIRLKSTPPISFPLHKMNDLITRMERKIPNIYSYRIPDLMRTYGWGPYLRGLRNSISRGNYWVVHASIFPTTTAYSALKVSKKYGIPFVFTPYLHYKIGSFRSSYLMKYMLNNSDAVIACTPQEADSIKEMGIDDGRVHTIPLSFDPDPVKELIISRDDAKQHFLLGNRFVVLSHPWVSKGIISVIEGIARVSKKHNIALLTIGEPDTQYVRERDRILKTYPELLFIDLGWVPSKLKWLAFSACDIFVMPSFNDAFGLSYLNAWAARKPIVAAKGSASSSLFDNNENGYLIDPESPRELAEILSFLMDESDEINRLGKNGEKKLYSHFSPKIMTNKYESVFRTVLKER